MGSITFLNLIGMKNKELTRRTFLRKTSFGAAGLALASNNFSRLFANIQQDSNKLALLGGNPVRPKGSVLGIKWPVIEKRDLEMYIKAFRDKNWSEYSNRKEEFGTQFNEEYAKFMGVNYCAVTNAGTQALEAA